MRQRLLPIDGGQLLSSAISRSGLDFSGKRLEEALDKLADLLNNEANLSLFGRIAVKEHLTELLITRFRLMERWQQSPEIQAQEIGPQIFITGLPKSGSTFLHRLLACDSNNRVPRMWEVMFPLPLRNNGNNDTDLRIRKAQMRLQWLRWVHPELVKSHPIGPLMPQECGEILGYSLESDIFMDMFFIPSYEEWLEKRDTRHAYEFHKNFLRHLQWQSPVRRWVLKSSDHIRHIKTLLEIYPDAYMVFLHRDPVKVLQASSSQQTLLKRLFSCNLDPVALAHEETRSLHDKTKKIMMIRDSNTVRTDRLMDVRYMDLSADPVGTVRAIYERFGFLLSSEDEARMAAFADSERNGHRSEKFSLSDFGLNAEREYPSFEAYSRRFNVEREILK